MAGAGVDLTTSAEVTPEGEVKPCVSGGGVRVPRGVTFCAVVVSFEPPPLPPTAEWGVSGVPVLGGSDKWGGGGFVLEIICNRPSQNKSHWARPRETSSKRVHVAPTPALHPTAFL